MTEFKTDVDIEQKVKELNSLKKEILLKIAMSKRPAAEELINTMSSLIATIATDVAIKAATDTFVKKVKESAEAGKARNELEA